MNYRFIKSPTNNAADVYDNTITHVYTKEIKPGLSL